MLSKKIFSILPLTLQTELTLKIPPETILQRLQKLAFGKFTYSETEHTFRFLTMIKGVFWARRSADLFYITGEVHTGEEICTVKYIIYPGYTFWISCILAIFLNVLFFICFSVAARGIPLWPNLCIGTLIILTARRHQRLCSEKLNTLLCDGRILMEF